MRSGIVFAGLALISAVALITSSVLLIGYAASAASLMSIVALLVGRMLSGRSAPPIESAVPRWIDSEDREAA